MQVLKINNFLGLSRDIDFADLKEGQAYDILNLNCDIPLGKLSLRKGTQKYFNTTFTNLISMIEHKFPTPNVKKIIVNDNGTLKVWDGSSWTTLSMPIINGNSAAIDTSFVNQFFGRDDYVIITTGAGETNYILWYGYIDKDISNDDGIFGDKEGFAGFKLTRAQLIELNGNFSNIRSITKYGDYYYITINKSKIIQKRDSNFRLVDTFDLFEDINTVSDVILYANKNRLFAAVAGADDSTKDGAYVFDPSTGFKQESFTNLSNLTDIFADDQYIFVTASDGAGGGFLRQYNISLSSIISQVSSTDFTSVYGDDFNNSSYVFVVKSGPVLEKRSVGTLTTISASYSTLTNPSDVVVSGDYVYLSDVDDNSVKKLATLDLSLINTYSNLAKPTYFVNGIDYVISSQYGILHDYTDASQAAKYPQFISINAISETSGGTLTSGYYFYKISVVDIDGNEFTLSDPAIYNLENSDYKINLVITALKDQLDEYYRISHINIYRAYSAIDSENPETEYMFLKKIDINSPKWYEKSYNFYAIDYEDNSDTSSVTYYENSGISDNTLPRHVNGKYMVWDGVQLHLANIYYNGNTYPNMILRSPQLQPANVAFYDSYLFGTDGMEIIGITLWLNRIIAFKYISMGIFYNGSFENGYEIGISSERSFYSMPKGIIFANNKGIYFYNGGEPERINQPVHDIYNSQTGFSDLTVFYFAEEDRIIISKDNNWSLVFNIVNKQWMKYDANFAFAKYIKTYDNEYLCFGGVDNNTGIYQIKENTKDFANYDGSGGNEISISYKTGLIRPGRIDGNAVLIFQLSPRFRFAGTNLTLKMNKYKNTGETNILNQQLTSPTGDYVNYKNIYPDSQFGESFTIELNGTVTDFEFTDLSILFDKIGILPDE